MTIAGSSLSHSFFVLLSAPGDLKELDHKFFVVFAGETLGNLSRGKIRAPLHYVDEYVGDYEMSC